MMTARKSLQQADEQGNQAGVKTKVLMLSATPVNNRFNDLRNQLQLAYEGNVDNINSKLELKTSVDDVFRLAQKAYNEWAALNAEERTLENLLKSLSLIFSIFWMR